MVQVRELLNYGNGRLFVTGQDVSFLPFALPNSYSDDFWQYYMGAQTHLEGAGSDPATGLHRVLDRAEVVAHDFAAVVATCLDDGADRRLEPRRQ